MANKVLCIEKWTKLNLSKTWKKRISRFAVYDEYTGRYTLPIPLIGQLGKNYYNGYNKLINGDDLLSLALNKIEVVQGIIGGKIVFVECEPKEKIVEFYERNGFIEFSRRKLDPDETNVDGDELVQLIRHM